MLAVLHTPEPGHFQPAYKGKIRCHNDTSVTEDFKNKILSLPIYPELAVKAQNKVADIIGSFFNGY